MDAHEEHRAACEARYVCKIKGVHARRDYLDGVERKRGKAAADKLRDDVKREWGKHEKRNEG